MTARERTLQRMKRLLAFATAVGASACDHSHGYGVVDPMPPPPRCPGVAQTITASAAWRQDEVPHADGTKEMRWRIVVTLSAPTFAGAKLPPPSPPSPATSTSTSATTVMATPEPYAPTFEPTPAGGVVVTFDAENARTRGYSGVECDCGSTHGLVAIYIEVPSVLGGAELPKVHLSDQ
jgi:hypothetical protein